MQGLQTQKRIIGIAPRALTSRDTRHTRRHEAPHYTARMRVSSRIPSLRLGRLSPFERGGPSGLLPIAALLALLAAAPAADAQWTWRDKAGQINASDRPPPKEIPEKDILARPSSAGAARSTTVAAPPSAELAASVAAAARTPLEREVEARKRAAEQEQSAKAKADEARQTAQRAENCRRARSHQAALDSGQRMARYDDKGERQILDDQARADEMRQAREVIAADCR